MAVSVLARTDTLQDGLQAFDARRHLGGVADLVGRVFADELDARGRSAVREMQTAGKLGPLLGGLMQSAMFQDMIAGFVWLSDGRIVGNVTIQPMDQNGLRWRISNVAVSAEQRGRGIPRLLMAAALREIAQRGGTWSTLQVRVDNPTARRLYDRWGFSEVTSDGIWRLPVLAGKPPEVEGAERLRPLPGTAWRSSYELAKSIQTPLEMWAEQIRTEQYQTGRMALAGETLGRLTGMWRVERWAAWSTDGMTGMVETHAAVTAPFTLRFLVRKDARGALESALVTRGLPRSVPGRSRPCGGRAQSGSYRRCGRAGSVWFPGATHSGDHAPAGRTRRPRIVTCRRTTRTRYEHKSFSRRADADFEYGQRWADYRRGGRAAARSP